MGDAQLNPGQGAAGDSADSGAGADQRDAGSQDTTPTLDQLQKKLDSLTADIGRERDRRKAAEQKLQDLQTQQEIAGAQSAEELQALKKKTADEITQARRDAGLRVAAAQAGIDEAFIRQADDGQADVKDVLTAAKAAQEAFIQSRADATGTITLKPGGASPDGKGARIWKASEVAAMDSKTFREKEAEILQAQRDGNYRPDE